MINKTIVNRCEKRLLELKLEYEGKLHRAKSEEMSEARGDAADLCAIYNEQRTQGLFQNRIRQQLRRIETALVRIRVGEYGICEETGEPIEKERLYAVPWTTLSLEGASIRERMEMRKIS